MTREHIEGICDDVECRDCCLHDDHDHGHCLNCDKDITEYLISKSDWLYEQMKERE